MHCAYFYREMHYDIEIIECYNYKWYIIEFSYTREVHDMDATDAVQQDVKIKIMGKRAIKFSSTSPDEKGTVGKFAR